MFLKQTRIGRCRLLPEDLVLAFTMGIHDRLGAASPVGTLAGKSELVSMIAMAGNRWVSGKAGKSEGLIRLLGGVSADRRARYVQKVTHDSLVTNRQTAILQEMPGAKLKTRVKPDPRRPPTAKHEAHQAVLNRQPRYCRKCQVPN